MFESLETIPKSHRKRDAVHLSLVTNTVTAHCKMGGKLDNESEPGEKPVASGLT